MNNRGNLGVALVFIVIGIILGVIASYLVSVMSDTEFIHIFKIFIIIVLILIGGIVTATGLIMMLTPIGEEE